MTQITSRDQFNTEITQWVVVADFYADWCWPCRMLAPIMEELSDENPEIKLLKVNVDENPDLASEYGVASIPVVFFFKDGNVADTILWANSKDVYQAKITALTAK